MSIKLSLLIWSYLFKSIGAIFGLLLETLHEVVSTDTLRLLWQGVQGHNAATEIEKLSFFLPTWQQKPKIERLEINCIAAEAQIYIGIFIESESCELTARALRHTLMPINRDLALWRK